MRNELDPIPGNWYTHLDKGQAFCVIDIDDNDGLIEIQHFDGDLEEVDVKEWATMDIELAPEPENASGPVDDPELDDLGYTGAEMSGKDWNESVDEYHDNRESWEIDKEPGGASPEEGVD
ncbi:MAG: hypothetical protein QNJ40_03505 [Xanthomonadales bacterium]|nr:hypothetical protein [Xanthomonadales bacterium]